MGSRDFRISVSREQAQWYGDSTTRVTASRVQRHVCIHKDWLATAAPGAGDDDKGFHSIVGHRAWITMHSEVISQLGALPRHLAASSTKRSRSSHSGKFQRAHSGVVGLPVTCGIGEGTNRLGEHGAGVGEIVWRTAAEVWHGAGEPGAGR